MQGNYNIQHIRNKLLDRPNLLKVASNTGWLFADKIIRMGMAVLVGVWVARYLGPTKYGLWNYAISLSTLLSVLGTLGMDNIVIRDLLGDPSKKNVLLGTCFILRLIGAVLALIITVIAAYYIRGGDRLILLLVALSSMGFVFQSLNVIDFYFQAHLKSKLTVYAQNLAFIITTVIKIILLLNKAGLPAFAWVSLLELVLAAVFIVIAYRSDKQHIRDWRVDWKLAGRLLKDSYPLILSGIAIMIYMRLDQVMLGEMIGDDAVGVYTAAIKLTEVWYFIPMSIGSSVFPVIIQAKQHNREEYYRKLQRLYNFMAMLGISVGIVTTFLAPYVIRLLYGEVYMASAGVLTITIWTGVMVCLSTVHGRWLLLENLQQYNMMYTILGAASNFIANLLLIPRFGVTGAAIGTLIAQFLPIFVALFIPRLRGNFNMMVLSLIFPFVWVFNFIKGRRSATGVP